VRYLGEKFGQKFDEPPRNERAVDRISTYLHGGKAKNSTTGVTIKSELNATSQKQSRIDTALDPYADLVNENKSKRS
jgi:hypothetical protein